MLWSVRLSMPRNRAPSAASARSSSGSSLNRSGGAESMSGLMARQTISMSWAYWLYASASCLLWRAISLRFSP